MPEFVEVTTIERDITCRHCGSTNLYKWGKYKDNQYYKCRDCKHKFAGIDAFPRMKYPKELNINAITYYFNGMSYRNISHTLNDMYGKSISKSTLHNWIIKFSKIANRHVLTLQPNLSNVWVADETVIDLWGEQYWFWDIIDAKTRFLIASHLSKTRRKTDAIKLFQMAKLRSKTRPKIVKTDKLGVYPKAFNKVFYSNYPERKVHHLKSEGFGSRSNINLIERFHGTLKQRTKVMRDLKKRESARIVLDGFVTHYNFFLEHEYLKGKTPAQAGGIKEEFSNWGDLLDVAYYSPRQNPEVRMEWEEQFEVV